MFIISVTVLLFTSCSFAENNTENPKEVIKKENNQVNNEQIKYDDNTVKKATENNNKTKQKTKIQLVSNKTFQLDKSNKIVLKITDEQDKIVTKGKVVVKVNENSISSGYVENGTYTTEYTYSGSSNNFALSVIYGENNKYQESKYNEKMLVKKAQPKLTIVNSSYVINPADGLKVHIKAEEKMIARMFIKINGKTFISHENVPFYRGFEGDTLTFEVLHSLIPYAAREYYNVTFVLPETSVYERTTISAIFKYERAKVNITIDNNVSTSSNTLTFSGKVNTKVALQNKFGIDKVCVKIDGKTLSDAKNKAIYTPLNLIFEKIDLKTGMFKKYLEDFNFSLSLPVPKLSKGVHTLTLCTAETRYVHGTRTSFEFKVV